MEILMDLTFWKKKTFLYTAYVDNAKFFLKDDKPVIESIKTFDIFSTFSGLKPNKSKYEIANFYAPKGVKLNGTLWNEIYWSILGAYYSYDKNLENQERFINLI